MLGLLAATLLLERASLAAPPPIPDRAPDQTFVDVWELPGRVFPAE